MIGYCATYDPVSYLTAARVPWYVYRAAKIRNDNVSVLRVLSVEGSVENPPFFKRRGHNTLCGDPEKI